MRENSVTDPASVHPTGDSLPSVELVHKAQGGDRAAIDRLFARYSPRLRRWAAGRLPRWARGVLDTEDLIQETLLHTFANFGAFEQRRDGALQAYLRQALRNRIRDELRRARRHPACKSLPSGAADPGASPLEQAMGQEVLKRYEQALGNLSEHDREAIVARIELGFSYDEVACALGKSSPDGARMAVSRALVRLARGMDRESD